MVEFKEITSWTGVQDFQKAFNTVLGYSTVPLEYFMSGECYGMFIDGKLVAGFCLVPGFLNLRAVMQLPEAEIVNLAYSPMSDHLADFTGYFLLKDTSWLNAFRFTVYLVKTCVRSPYKHFIYSYQVNEVKLGRYYAAGDPKRIYTGIPEHLDGHGENMEPEHVEILTKWGIVKIFLRRTYKVLKKMVGG